MADDAEEAPKAKDIRRPDASIACEVDRLNSFVNTISGVREKILGALGEVGKRVEALKEGCITDESFADIKDDCQFEIELQVARLRSYAVELEKGADQHMVNLYKASELAKQWEEIHADLREEVERLQEKEAMGPLLASQAARRLLLTGGADVEEPERSTQSAGTASSWNTGDCTSGCNCSKAGLTHASDSHDVDHCPHRETLAAKVIDGVFDQHLRLLRQKLRAAQEEIEALRNGTRYRLQEDEMAKLKSAIDKERELVDAANRKWVGCMKENLEIRQQLNKEIADLRNKVADLQTEVVDTGARASLHIDTEVLSVKDKAREHHHHLVTPVVAWTAAVDETLQQAGADLPILRGGGSRDVPVVGVASKEDCTDCEMCTSSDDEIGKALNTVTDRLVFFLKSVYRQMKPITPPSPAAPRTVPTPPERPSAPASSKPVKHTTPVPYGKGGSSIQRAPVYKREEATRSAPRTRHSAFDSTSPVVHMPISPSYKSSSASSRSLPHSLPPITLDGQQ